MQKDRIEKPEEMDSNDDHYKKILNKLTDSVVEEYARSNPAKPLISDHRNRIKHLLNGFFPDFHIPTHPTYSVMILKAIAELEEEGGSSEEAISEFIKQKFEDLPWAHSSLLNHHLKKLCHSEDIVVVSDNCYMLRKTEQGSKKKKKSEQGRGKKRQRATKHGYQSQEGRAVKKQKQSRKQEVVFTKQDGVQEFEKKIDGQNQSLEQTQREGNEVEVSEGQNVSGRHEFEETRGESLLKEHQEVSSEPINSGDTDVGESRNQALLAQVVEIFEGRSVATSHEPEEIGRKIEEQKQEVSCEPVKSGEFDVDEECNQVQLPEIERILDLKQAKRQPAAINSQSQAKTQLTKLNKENAQQSDEVLNILSGRQTEEYEDQMPTKQQFEEQEKASGKAVQGYEYSAQAEKKQEIAIREQNDYGQQIQVTRNHAKRKEQESKMINKQTEEPLNEMVEDQTQSPLQQSQQQDEGYKQPVPTQREETDVGVLQKSIAKWKDKVIQEQREEAQEQELDQGQKQVGDIERTLQYQEQQVEVVENLSELPRQQNEGIAERNNRLEKVNSQIDLSKVQELLLKQQGKEAHAAVSDPSTAKIFHSGGSLTLREKYDELRKRRHEIKVKYLKKRQEIEEAYLKEQQMIEEEICEISDVLSVSGGSNHFSLKPVGGIEELPLQIESPCGDDLMPSFNELHHVHKHLKHQGYSHLPGLLGDEDPVMVVLSPTGKQNDPKKQQPQSECPKRLLRPRSNLESSSSVSGLLDNHNHNLEKLQPEKDGLGRPPKPKLIAVDKTGEKLISKNKNGKRGRGRPRKEKLGADATTGVNLISQPKKDGRGRRGRPPKQKSDVDTKPGDILISQNKQERRGRPPKPKLDAHTTEGEILISENKQNDDTTAREVLVSLNKHDALTSTGDMTNLQHKQDADTPNGDALISQKKQEQKVRSSKRKFDSDTTTGDIDLKEPVEATKVSRQ